MSTRECLALVVLMAVSALNESENTVYDLFSGMNKDKDEKNRC